MIIMKNRIVIIKKTKTIKKKKRIKEDLVILIQDIQKDKSKIIEKDY